MESMPLKSPRVQLCSPMQLTFISSVVDKSKGSAVLVNAESVQEFVSTHSTSRQSMNSTLLHLTHLTFSNRRLKVASIHFSSMAVKTSTLWSGSILRLTWHLGRKVVGDQEEVGDKVGESVGSPSGFGVRIITPSDDTTATSAPVKPGDLLSMFSKRPWAMAVRSSPRISFGLTPESGEAVTVDTTLKQDPAADVSQSVSTVSTPKVTASAPILF
mmetsp:Transcript_1300/g.2932  ORF Transcript_1300/g.2932 Transcript_1300/m.2932 type:complete len:215 (+) Transcript_1300:327-971(+)